MAAIGITATAMPSLGSVRLSITGAPNEPLVITRTDGNGTGTVRLLAGQIPSSGQLVVDDFEHALAGDIAYTVSTAAPNASYDPGTATVALGYAGAIFGKNWLGVPVFPALNVEVAYVTEFTGDRQSKTTYHQVIGRQDDVANIQPLGLRAGSFSVRCASAQEADAVVAVLESTEYLLVRLWGVQGLDAYFLVESVSKAILAEDYAGGRRFEVAVSYREQKAPTAPRQGTLGWDVSDLAAAYTVAQAKAYFKTVANMTAGTKG